MKSQKNDQTKMNAVENGEQKKRAIALIAQCDSPVGIYDSDEASLRAAASLSVRRSVL